MILNDDQQASMRQAGKVLARILDELVERVKPGVSTAELDAYAEQRIKEEGVASSFKGYQGYPSVLCTSLNNEVVHCIPSTDRVIQEGDLVSLDFGVVVDGIHADAARTVAVGNVGEQAANLVQVTAEALDAGIKAAKPGNTTGDIGAAVQEHIAPSGFGIVRALVGHGIGTELHMEPQVPNVGKAGTGSRLEPGMAIAIEPMINLGGEDVEIDGWRVTTSDGSVSAHFEDTILITKNGPEILTRTHE